MWFMYILSWIALIIQICFITLSIAAGLYYLAELVEEYTVMTARVIKYLIWITTFLHLGLLLFESLPLSLIALGLLANALYFVLLKNFPVLDLASPAFIASLVVLVVNHYMAFSYFASVWHPFTEVLAFFTVLEWLVPFAFFVSLSANENVLPTSLDHQTKDESESDVVSNYFRRKGKRYGLLSLLKGAQESILPERMKKGY